jgi:hypothetical protein
MKLLVHLHRWGILRLPEGLVLAGAEDGEYPRVSTPLLLLEIEGGVAVTLSTQHYALEGEPEPNYALSAWTRFKRSAEVDAEIVDSVAAAAEVEAQRRAYIQKLREANLAVGDLIVDDDDDDAPGRKP